MKKAADHRQKNKEKIIYLGEKCYGYNIVSEISKTSKMRMSLLAIQSEIYQALNSRAFSFIYSYSTVQNVRKQNL